MRFARIRGDYYGWRMLLGLSTAELFSWGILYYAFSVMVRPIEAEFGWSRTQVTGAFSLALLVSGLAAVPVGHWLDARGPRALMSMGSALGALLFFALSRVASLPAFAVVATWFDRERDRALTILTVVGGLASTLLVPLTTWLVETQGWRGAAARLALLLGLTTTPLHAIFLRRSPAAIGQLPDGDREARVAVEVVPEGGLADILSEARFWRLTAAFALASAVGPTLQIRAPSAAPAAVLGR